MDSLVGPCRKYYAGLSTNGQQIGNVTFFASLGSKQDTTTGILPRYLPIDKIEHVKESCRGRQEDVISRIPGENWARIGPPVRITPESHHFCLLDDESKNSISRPSSPAVCVFSALSIPSFSSLKHLATCSSSPPFFSPPALPQQLLSTFPTMPKLPLTPVLPSRV